MATENRKPDPPAYISYALFTRFIKGLSDTGVPSRIDRSVLAKMSGAEQSSLIAALKFLGLIKADGAPTGKLTQLVESNEENYSTVLRDVLSASYKFLLESDLQLDKATGQQVADKFRELEISGSTVTKSMAFFLAAAKAAGIKVSDHVKPPAIQKSATPKKSKRQQSNGSDDDESPLPSKTEKPPVGMDRIVVPLKDLQDGVIYLPSGMDELQTKKAVNMAVYILKNFYGIEG